MTQRRERSIPELRRCGWICAAAAAGLVVGLLVWPRYARDWVFDSITANLSSRTTITLDVYHDLETGKYWIWDQPTGGVFVPRTEAEWAGEAALKKTRSRIEQGELARPAQYVAQFDSAYGPKLPWSSVPLWSRRSVRAWFVEYVTNAWRGFYRTGAMPPAIPEPAPGLAASGPVAFKAAYATQAPDFVAQLNRIGVGGVERSGMLVGMGYQLALILNVALIGFLALLAGRSWRSASRLAAHGTRHGLCPRCGYPVTTAMQTRCSECGASLPAIGGDTA